MTRWYRIITGDAQSRPDPTRQDHREQAAIRLAQAEAQLERTSMAEREQLLDLHKQRAQVETDPSGVQRVIARLKEPNRNLDDYDTLIVLAENLEDPVFARLARSLARSSPTRPAALRETRTTLTRYRRDAESARRSALKAWIKVKP